jgi:UDP-N-acetylglucosamine 2-epimerase (non-hydrolysing)
LEKRGYFLVTAHRQENVDVRDRLKGILEGLALVYRKFRLPLIYPVHPRARRRIEEFRLGIPSGLKVIEPVGFLDFLTLEADAALVLTDSGSVQEETCVLQVPCVTLRDNTERPETLGVGSNVLAGANQKRILQGVDLMLTKERKWPNPFGDGQAGERVVRLLVCR